MTHPATILIFNETCITGQLIPDVQISCKSSNVTPVPPPSITVHAGTPYSQTITVNDSRTSALGFNLTSSDNTVTKWDSKVTEQWSTTPESFSDTRAAAFIAPILSSDPTQPSAILNYFVGGNAAPWLQLQLQAMIPSVLTTFNAHGPYPVSISGFNFQITKLALDPSNANLTYASQLPGPNQEAVYRVILDVTNLAADVLFGGSNYTITMERGSLMLHGGFAPAATGGQFVFVVQELLASLHGDIDMKDGLSFIGYIVAQDFNNPTNNAVFIAEINKFLAGHPLPLAATPSSPAAESSAPEWVTFLAQLPTTV